MRAIVLSACLALLGSASTLAADITSADIAPEFAPAQNFSWTGAYVGLFGGFGVADVDVTDEDGFNGDPGRVFDYRVDGFTGGVLGGYNYEWSLLVFGAEAELGVMDLDDGEQDPAVDGTSGRADDSIARYDASLYGAVTGRVGLSIDRFLGYAKAGVAVAGVQASFDDDGPADAEGEALEGSEEEDWITGWTVGGGVEMAVNPNFSLRGEYTFTDFTESVTTTSTDELGRDFEFEHDLEDLHIGKFAAVYRF